jgi:hypothetical protein
MVRGGRLLEPYMTRMEGSGGEWLFSLAQSRQRWMNRGEASRAAEHVA